jgi:hypothetical protein
MSHWIYFLLGAGISGLIVMIVTYSFVCSHYTKKEQQRKIIKFIRSMRRLSRDGKIELVKNSIKIFAKQCIKFNVDSFSVFSKKEFKTIAHCVSMYQYQNYHSTHDDGIGVTPVFQEMSDNYISEDETQVKICKSLCQIIGV